MFQRPSQSSIQNSRRRQCVQMVHPALRTLVEHVHRAGWSREEILVAIADAADEQLGDLTESDAAPGRETVILRRSRAQRYSTSHNAHTANPIADIR